jgi:translation initiation factor 3 subunit C
MDDDDSLSDDSMFKDNDLSDDSDSDDDDMFAPPAAAAAAKGDGRVLAGRARWLKKPESEKKRKAKEVKAAVPRKQGDGKTAVVTKRVQVVERPLTEDEVNVRIADVVASRGRKGTDPRELLRKLEVLSRQARRHGPRVEVPVVMHLISVMYDSHRVIDDYMDRSAWRTAFRYLMRVVALLNADKGLTLGMLPTEDVATASATSGLMKKDKDEDGAAEGAAAAAGDNSNTRSSGNENVILVVGTLETFLSRLEGEYTKSLQQINPHSKVRLSYLISLSTSFLDCFVSPSPSPSSCERQGHVSCLHASCGCAVAGTSSGRGIAATLA